jgi:hypothetical protein
MEAASTCETSVNLYHAARRNNPEDSHLHTRYRENLKSRNSKNTHNKLIWKTNNHLSTLASRTVSNGWRA